VIAIIPVTMRSGRVLTIAAAVLSSLSSAAQEPQSKPCIAADERIYKLVDGVKPPQPQSDKDAKDAPKRRGHVSFQLVVSAEGHVCSVKVVAASDKSSAEDAANYIAQHWRFKPATKEGKPVAVTFTVQFP
jgi:TonB family protein